MYVHHENTLQGTATPHRPSVPTISEESHCSITVNKIGKFLGYYHPRRNKSDRKELKYV